MRNRALILAAAFAGAVLLVPAATQAQTSEARAAGDRFLAMLGIPMRAEEIRKAGVPDSSVRSVLDILRAKQLPAKDVEEILITERDAAREHGPTDNFGAFVQSRLDQGLRGRDLAAAIRAEHAARGKGKGYSKERPLGGRDNDNDDDDDEAKKRDRQDDARDASKGKRSESTPSKGPGSKRPN